MKKKIKYALEWYSGTDGAEREEAADMMFELLLTIYESFILTEVPKPHKTKKRK